MIDDDLQAFFEWCVEDERRTMEWLRQVAEEDVTFWDDVLASVPTCGDIGH
jgi:hypothetical protein